MKRREMAKFFVLDNFFFTPYRKLTFKLMDLHAPEGDVFLLMTPKKTSLCLPAVRQTVLEISCGQTYTHTRRQTDRHTYRQSFPDPPGVTGCAILIAKSCSA